MVLLGVVTVCAPLMGKSKASKSAKELFAKNQGINLLAAARVVLFGARDVWFVVGVPVFLVCVRLVTAHGGRLSGGLDHWLWRSAGLCAAPGANAARTA
jgi:hypothetical protein